MKKMCKICEEEKTRIQIGRRKTGPIFVNEMQKEWNGRTCPECNVLRSKGNMQKFRSEK